MQQLVTRARAWSALAALVLAASIHALGQSRTLPQATITGATGDPDDKDHHFKQCPNHALTLTIALPPEFPIGSARAELFHLPTAGTTGPGGQAQPATWPAVTMPQRNMLIEAHNNQRGTTGSRTVVVFPPDKNTSGPLDSSDLDLDKNYHLGPDCPDGGPTVCTAIISISPTTLSGRTARDPTLAYFYTYQTYPPGQAGQSPGPCAATRNNSGRTLAKSRRH